MAHLICLSIFRPQMYGIGLKCTYIWGRFGLKCTAVWLAQTDSASNVQLSDLLRQITWQNKLNLQMYIHLRQILYIWGQIWNWPQMYSSLIGSDTESASNVRTFEADSLKMFKSLTFDSNSTSIRCAKKLAQSCYNYINNMDFYEFGKLLWIVLANPRYRLYIYIFN